MKKKVLLSVMFFSCLHFVYSQAGELDPSFGNNGIVKKDIASTAPVFQKDGKIVMVGTKWNGSNYDFAIARYNTDGSLDKTFSDDGIQTTDFNSSNDRAVSVAIQSDGKIVVAGNTNYTDTENIDSYIFSVARYNSNGSLDDTFSTNGKVQTDFYNNGRNEARSVVIQSDGKIVLIGIAYITNSDVPNSVVVRYNTDGSLDKTYNEDGKETILFSHSSDTQGFATLGVIQNDDKIVVGALTIGDTGPNNVSLERINTDGSTDSTYGENGEVTAVSSDAQSFAIAIQKDGKIALSSSLWYRGESEDITDRFNIDGSLDIHKRINYGGDIYSPRPDFFSNFVATQNNGKIVSLGFNLHVYNADGSFDSTFSGNGQNPGFTNVAINNNKLYASVSDNIARYFLDDKTQTPPTVTLTTPTNNTTRLAPAAHIKLSAAASDADGTISKVEFYNGTHLLHTETVIPYGFVWRNVPLGNYTLTAKAYDNSGLVTTSSPVHISVVPNKPPVVSIINPKNNETFAASPNIQIEADAKDADGRMTRVEFYSGSTLLNTQYQLPYRFVWKDIPAGTYTITAVARDNWGARTTSAPVTFTVRSNTSIVSSRASVNSIDKVNAASITLSPNPANTIVNLYTTGLQQDKVATIRVLSASGVVMKMMHLNSSAKTIQLDVSSLVKGVYMIQLVSDDKVLYKQFVKF